MAIVSGGTGGSSSVGYLGSATITGGFTTAATSPAQVTGLTAAVTVPAGVRVKITVSVGELYNTTATNYATAILWDGTVGSGTQLMTMVQRTVNASDVTPGCMVAVVNPGAGAKTYNVSLHATGGGSAGISASASEPALLLVEAI